MHHEKLFTRKTLAETLGVTPAEVDRLRRLSEMPQPFFIGRLPRWRPETINEWLAEKEKERIDEDSERTSVAEK